MLINRKPVASGSAASGPALLASAGEQRPSSPTPRIMRVGSIATTATTPTDQLKARTAPKRVRSVPNCTHMTMERVHYDDFPCPACGRMPPTGFLYECRQDSDVAFSHCSAVVDDESPSESAKSTLRRELEDIGLSESVIKSAERGGYTEQQLEKLKALKEEMKQVIADAVQAQQINNAVVKLHYYGQGPSNNDGALNSSPAKDSVSLDALTFGALPLLTASVCATLLLSRMPHMSTLLQGPHLPLLRRCLFKRGQAP
jgi:hypothetical protein